MIRGFANEGGRLRPIAAPAETDEPLVWIDLFNPSKDEENALERRLGIDIPTREEMEEIEISSRLYTTDGAWFMTAMLPAQTDGEDPQVAPVSFVLSGNRLVTVRYHEPRAFQSFPVRAEKVAMGCETGEGVLIALLDAIVDRVADILERSGRDIERTSREVFRHKVAEPAKAKDLQSILAAVGREGDFVSNIRDSLVTLDRLVGFLSQGTVERNSPEAIRERVKTLSRDVRSLSDHADFLSQKVTFLLDATLGMINIEQNAIIKIFSVAAVVFLPPTLIASIYGMNFKFMPELDEVYGYPLALVLMIVSAILPYLYFKRRGWL